MDPLLGVQNDFDYPDYCVVSLMHQLESHFLFALSMRVAQVGQAIATINFLDLEGERYSQSRRTTEVKVNSKISFVEHFFIVIINSKSIDCKLINN